MIAIFSMFFNRVEDVHLQRDGSNKNTIISCGRDGLIKYWNTERYIMVIIVLSFCTFTNADYNL